MAEHWSNMMPVSGSTASRAMADEVITDASTTDAVTTKCGPTCTTSGPPASNSHASLTVRVPSSPPPRWNRTAGGGTSGTTSDRPEVSCRRRDCPRTRRLESEPGARGLSAVAGAASEARRRRTCEPAAAPQIRCKPGAEQRASVLQRSLPLRCSAGARQLRRGPARSPRSRAGGPGGPRRTGAVDPPAGPRGWRWWGVLLLMRC